MAAMFIGMIANAQITNSQGNVYVIDEINSGHVTLLVYESVDIYKSDSIVNSERTSIYLSKELLQEAENNITSLDGMTLLEKRNEAVYLLLIENSKTQYQNWRRTQFEKSDLKYEKI